MAHIVHRTLVSGEAARLGDAGKPSVISGGQPGRFERPEERSPKLFVTNTPVFEATFYSTGTVMASRQALTRPQKLPLHGFDAP
jgi:hypothetical protein